MSDTRTLGDMIRRITREIRRDGLTADIRNSIVVAIESVQHRRFWFNEGEVTATASSGTLTVNLPRAFIEADEVYFEDSSSARFVLRPVHWEDLISRQVISNSQPTEYTIFYDTIHIRPPPDKDYELRIAGLHELTEISASASAGSGNAWTQEAESMIRPLAKADLYRGRLRNDERAAVHQAEADFAMNRLLGRTAQEISTGKLRKTDF